MQKCSKIVVLKKTKIQKDKIQNTNTKYRLQKKSQKLNMQQGNMFNLKFKSREKSGRAQQYNRY